MTIPTAEFLTALVGVSYDEARARCEQNYFKFRPAKIDGQAMILTRDLRGDRVNVEVLHGDVTAAYPG